MRATVMSQASGTWAGSTSATHNHSGSQRPESLSRFDLPKDFHFLLAGFIPLARGASLEVQSMKKHHLSVLVLSCFLALWTLPTINAQVSGQLSGIVTDDAGAAVPGAVVTVTQVLSKQARSFVTQMTGTFSFPGLLTGDYDLHIEKPGFKAYNQRGITIAAQENLSLPEIRLTIGEVNTSITVQAEA